MLEEFDEACPSYGMMPEMCIRKDAINFLRSAIETAFKEVRPRKSRKYNHVESVIGWNNALSDYDQAVIKYLGK